MRRCGNRYESDPKKIQKDRETLAPKPLPPVRPRALTCPLPQPQPQPRKLCRSWNIFKKFIPKQKTFDQSQSPLFARLPYEIRCQIWSRVLGNRLLHIVRVPKTLLAIECVEDFGPDLETCQHRCWGFITGPPFSSALGFYESPHPDHPSKPANFLPLLQTCVWFTQRPSQSFTKLIYLTSNISTPSSTSAAQFCLGVWTRLAF